MKCTVKTISRLTYRTWSLTTPTRTYRRRK
nr:MAG TPA: hypothetical protein [Caudoviricetes sp.]